MTADLAIPNTESLAATCAVDGELRLACRFWTGGVRITIGDQLTGFTVTDGEISAGVPEAGGAVISLAGSADVWAPLLEATPPPFANLAVLTGLGNGRGISRSSTDPLIWWQYTPAVERVAELLRAPGGLRAQVKESITHGGSLPRYDSPVGGYVHIDIEGVDHRIYYEEYGTGIPMLLQHTAGAHSVQYRHLFEMPEITDRFRLIAYDLPYHGKSIPPVDQRWWEEEYRLRGSFLRQVPVGLASALELDEPVFMGCSVGGLLALDIALHHPDVFRAVISLEGALKVAGDWTRLEGFWHPQVSNHSKARAMESLCSPTSPEPYVKEVSQVYSAGWPPVFLGDLYYYLVDFDLTAQASEIDTDKIAVHILNGDYDWSGTPQGGLAAHEAIAGSTHTLMRDMGHFPMQENPVAFAEYLAPILQSIAGTGA